MAASPNWNFLLTVIIRNTVAYIPMLILLLAYFRCWRLHRTGAGGLLVAFQVVALVLHAASMATTILLQARGGPGTMVAGLMMAVYAARLAAAVIIAVALLVWVNQLTQRVVLLETMRSDDSE